MLIKHLQYCKVREVLFGVSTALITLNYVKIHFDKNIINLVGVKISI